MPREVKAEKKAQKGRDCGNVSASPAKGEDAASHLATWQTKSETQGTEKRNEGRKETKTLVHLAKAKPTLALHSEEPRTLRCRRGSADKGDTARQPSIYVTESKTTTTKRRGSTGEKHSTLAPCPWVEPAQDFAGPVEKFYPWQQQLPEDQPVVEDAVGREWLRGASTDDGGKKLLLLGRLSYTKS